MTNFAVAERVYKSYKTNGLYWKETSISLELDLPGLADYHDQQMIQISQLSEDHDPEILKYYLLALVNNELADVFYNESRTRAIALFKQPLESNTQYFIIPIILLDAKKLFT